MSCTANHFCVQPPIMCTYCQLFLCTVSNLVYCQSFPSTASNLAYCQSFVSSLQSHVLPMQSFLCTVLQSCVLAIISVYSIQSCVLPIISVYSLQSRVLPIISVYSLKSHVLPIIYVYIIQSHVLTIISVYSFWSCVLPKSFHLVVAPFRCNQASYHLLQSPPSLFTKCDKINFPWHAQR